VDYDVAVFSDLESGVLSKCHLRAAEPAAVIEEWVSSFDDTPRLAVIPTANTTYFYKSAGGSTLAAGDKG
jgi:hypothetical protein